MDLTAITEVVLCIMAIMAIAITAMIKVNRDIEEVRLKREAISKALLEDSNAKHQTLEPMGVPAQVIATHSIQAEIRQRLAERSLAEPYSRREYTAPENGSIDVLQLQQRMNHYDTATGVMLQAQRIAEAGGIERVIDRYLASPTVAEITRQREIRLANERAAVRADGFSIPEPMKPKRELLVNRGPRKVRV